MKIKDFLGRYPLWISFIFMTICLLPVMALRDFSPSNELRYLSIADEALANGYIFAFNYQGFPYADKPPLYLWLIMLCKLVFGRHSMLVLSLLFSYIPSIVIIWVMDKWVGSALKAEGKIPSTELRLAQALMLGTCGMFIGTAIFLRMDMLMSMFIVLSLYSFYSLFTGEGKTAIQSILLPVWIFMALFTKGPVGLLMPPVTILCFLFVKGRGRQIGKYLGWKTWGIIALLSAVWLTGAFVDGGNEYINNLLFHQTVGRAVSAFTHEHPFWYYLMAIWYCTLPYCLLLVGCVVAGFFGWRNKLHFKAFSRKKNITAALEDHSSVRSDSNVNYKIDSTTPSDAETLFMCAIVSTFVMLSSFSSKLAVYLLPIIPFMAALFPLILSRLGWRKWMTWCVAIMAGLLALIGLVGLVGLVFFGEMLAPMLVDAPYLYSTQILIALAIIFLGSSYALVCVFRKSTPGRVIFLSASTILVAVYFGSWVMPEINKYTAYGAICSEVPAEGDIAALYLHRPEAMDVYLGREVVNYQKDSEAFFLSLSQRTHADGSLTLISKVSRIPKDPLLQDFCSTHEITICGPYWLCVIE